MKNGTHLFFQEILDRRRLELLPKLLFFKKQGFYLAGGTALALFYGHRESVDFDFFIDKDIDTQKLFKLIVDEFCSEVVIKTYSEKNTLYITIDNIKFSFMTYKYSFIGDVVDTEFITLASEIDIACMKLWAIQNRATNKDYVDLYYILQKYPLENLIQSFYKKFGNIVNQNLILKSLVYFDDIEEQELIMIKKLNFDEVKVFLKNVIK